MKNLGIASFVVCGSLFWLATPEGRSAVPQRRSQVLGPESIKLSNIRLLTDERVFAVMAALNAAGFEEESAGQGRSTTRNLLQEWIGDLDEDLSYRLRAFYKSHRPSSEILRENPQAAYVSLALWLSPAPEFRLEAEDAAVPSDVWLVRGFANLVREFWVEADLPGLWETMEPLYAVELENYRPLFEDVVTTTLEYFRVPVRVSLAKEIILIVDLLDVKNMVNARNLDRTYFLVVGPSEDATSNHAQLEHEYLHFLLDDLIEKYGVSLLEHESLMDLAQRQPDTRHEYQNKFLLVATESLIEALHTRLNPPGQPDELDKRMVEFFRRGLILAPYFYRALEKYEQTEGQTFPSYLETVIAGVKEGPVRKDAKAIGELEKAHRAAEAELHEATRKEQEDIKLHNEYVRQFNTASKLLSEARFAEARTLLQKLRQTYPHNGKILFYLGQSAFQLQDYDSAFEYYRQCSGSPEIEVWIVAWSRVRMGRILASRGDYDEAGKLFAQVQSMEGSLRGAGDEADRLLEELPE